MNDNSNVRVRLCEQIHDNVNDALAKDLILVAEAQHISVPQWIATLSYLIAITIADSTTSPKAAKAVAFLHAEYILNMAITTKEDIE